MIRIATKNSNVYKVCYLVDKYLCNVILEDKMLSNVDVVHCTGDCECKFSEMLHIPKTRAEFAENWVERGK